jgi:peptide/nickel transport system permease protein
MAVAGAVLLGAIVLAALLADVLAPHPYAEQHLVDALLPPAWLPGGQATYPLGTDHLGRDLLSRILFGARTSLEVGLGAVFIASLLGVTLGLISGYRGGWLDDLVMRVVDVQLAFPALFLVIAIMAAVGQSLLNVILVLGLVSWVQFARVVRGSTLAVKEREFVTSARSIGAGAGRIIGRHILPNVLQPVIVIATVNASSFILAEAALSFLGLGVQPPTPAWGGMLAEGREVFRTAWWNAVMPGLAILLTVLGINLLGDAFETPT